LDFIINVGSLFFSKEPINLLFSVVLAQESGLPLIQPYSLIALLFSAMPAQESGLLFI
jgi:hypothetical protein